MAPSSIRGRGQRAGLDGRQVLLAAREILRDQGVEGLSMRAVARRLGVAPNALYGHVGNRDQLLDAILDDVLAEVALPTEDDLERDPTAAVRAIMLTSYDVLVAHPGLMPAYLERQGARGVQARRLGRVTMSALGRAGLDPEPAQAAMRVLIVHTIGFAAFSARPAGSRPGAIPAEELRGNFETGLDWLLAAITR